MFDAQVTHSPLGKVILEAFVVDICKAPTDWDMANIAEEFIVEVSTEFLNLTPVELELKLELSCPHGGSAIVKGVGVDSFTR